MAVKASSLSSSSDKSSSSSSSSSSFASSSNNNNNNNNGSSSSKHEQKHKHKQIDALCFGTSSRLKSLLIPILIKLGYHPALIHPKTQQTQQGSTGTTGTTGTTRSSTRPNATATSCYEEEEVEKKKKDDGGCGDDDGEMITSTGTEEEEEEDTQCGYRKFSLKNDDDQHTLVEVLQGMEDHDHGISILGVGGLTTTTTTTNTTSEEQEGQLIMKELYDLLHLFCCLINDGTWKSNTTTNNNNNNKIVVLSTDNDIPNNNGDYIKSVMMEFATNKNQGVGVGVGVDVDVDVDGNDDGQMDDTKMMMIDFLSTKVIFLNTIVDDDRIIPSSSHHRDDDDDDDDDAKIKPLQQLPSNNKKASLVILDPNNDLLFKAKRKNHHHHHHQEDTSKLPNIGVVIIRSTQQQFDFDIALKLRIKETTITILSYIIALLGKKSSSSTTSNLQQQQQQQEQPSSSSLLLLSLLLRYLDKLVYNQIIPSVVNEFTTTTTTSSSSSTSTAGEEEETKTKTTNAAPAAAVLSLQQEANDYYKDWRERLLMMTTDHHPNYFDVDLLGENTNGYNSKGSFIQLLSPTISTLFRLSSSSSLAPTKSSSSSSSSLQVGMAFAYAVLLRWLTPMNMTKTKANDDDGGDGFTIEDDKNSDSQKLLFADDLRSCIGKQPSDCFSVIRSYLVHPNGGNIIQQFNNNNMESTKLFDDFVCAIAVLYSRMVAGDKIIDILHELDDENNNKYGSISFDTPCSCYHNMTTLLGGRRGNGSNNNINTRKNETKKFLSFLQYHPNYIPNTSNLMNGIIDNNNVEDVVISEIQGAIGIDLHTHLLPPTHGSLCLWGIDELLTYHYLVAEYFMTAPPTISPDDFYAMTKQQQADLIWQALFLDRTPISEATRGVLTTLQSLGLHNEIQSRDLNSIRNYYKSTYRSKGLEEGSKEFCEMVFQKAGIGYAIMTNIPFDVEEAKYWRPFRTQYSNRFRSALRVDPLLTGDREAIEFALKASGYPCTLEGTRDYLRGWVDTMQPCYMMASTPHDFVLKDQQGTTTTTSNKNSMGRRGVNMDTMDEPFAFVQQLAAQQGIDANCNPVSGCDGAEDDTPSVIDEHSDFLSQVLIKVCEERDLPIALKIGAHRGVNPKLKSAGDGLVAFADASMLSRLCTRFPKVRFLATFLSRNNQHEACVLATKFRNLHIYGCWWFCNNPSLIREITTMRIEMLGTAFTAQHSDARVMDQLLYKWPHFRAILAEVMIEEIRKSIDSGWYPTRSEIRRDINRLFRGSYEEFMAKSLLSSSS